MGSFANQLFALMMGWLQGIFSAVWSLFSAGGNPSWYKWFGEHWPGLALLLCLTGAAADLIVYLFRWRPIQVLKSYLHRIRKRRESAVPAPDQNHPDEASAGSDAGANREEELERSRRQALILEEEQLALSHREIAEESIRNSSRRRFKRNLFTENGEKAPVSMAPQELFNSHDTYHRPVYPRKWKANEERHESTDESM